MPACRTLPADATAGPERDPQRAADLRKELNALIAEGNEASTEVLEAANVSEMELFIAVTDLDEVNLIACLPAHDHGAPRIIARIKSLEYTKAEWNRTRWNQATRCFSSAASATCPPSPRCSDSKSGKPRAFLCWAEANLQKNEQPHDAFSPIG